MLSLCAKPWSGWGTGWSSEALPLRGGSTDHLSVTNALGYYPAGDTTSITCARKHNHTYDKYLKINIDYSAQSATRKPIAGTIYGRRRLRDRLRSRPGAFLW